MHGVDQSVEFGNVALSQCEAIYMLGHNLERHDGKF